MMNIFMYITGALTGFMLSLNLGQNERRQLHEHNLIEICKNANSKVDFYTEKVVVCTSGARFEFDINEIANDKALKDGG